MTFICDSVTAMIIINDREMNWQGRKHRNKSLVFWSMYLYWRKKLLNTLL